MCLGPFRPHGRKIRPCFSTGFGRKACSPMPMVTTGPQFLSNPTCGDPLATQFTNFSSLTPPLPRGFNALRWRFTTMSIHWQWPRQWHFATFQSQCPRVPNAVVHWHTGTSPRKVRMCTCFRIKMLHTCLTKQNNLPSLGDGGKVYEYFPLHLFRNCNHRAPCSSSWSGNFHLNNASR